MAALYKYQLRPEYRSENLLIEIISGFDADSPTKFVSDLKEVISEIQPKITDIHDLWMNDEMFFCMTSDEGDFTVSVTIWGIAFIMASRNQKVILKIDSVLQNDANFEKLPVNLENYI